MDSKSNILNISQIYDEATNPRTSREQEVDQMLVNEKLIAEQQLKEAKAFWLNLNVTQQHLEQLKNRVARLDEGINAIILSGQQVNFVYLAERATLTKVINLAQGNITSYES